MSTIDTSTANDTSARSPVEPGVLVAWLTPAVSPRSVSIWRTWSGVVLAGYLLVRVGPLTNFVGVWRPVGVLRWASEPFAPVVLLILWVLSLAAALHFVRPTGSPTGARWITGVGVLATVVLFTHRSSGGQILWFDILPALHLVALWLAGSRFDAIRAGWAMRLASITTAITYVLAGVAKLRIGGTAWIAEGALERQITWSATRLEVLGGSPSPVAAPLVELGLASVPLALAVVVIELGAPVALIGRRTAWVWSIAAWSMHVVIALTMFVAFHWPLLGIAFVPTLLLARNRANEVTATAA